MTGVVGAAIQKVREIESQLDNAVGVEKPVGSSSVSPVTLLPESTRTLSPTPSTDDNPSTDNQPVTTRETTNKKMKSKKKISPASSATNLNIDSGIVSSKAEVQDSLATYPNEPPSDVDIKRGSTFTADSHTSNDQAKQIEDLQTQLNRLTESHSKEVSNLINKHEEAVRTMKIQHETEIQTYIQLQTNLQEQIKGLQSDKEVLQSQLRTCLEIDTKTSEFDRAISQDNSVEAKYTNRIEELQLQLQEQAHLVSLREHEVLNLELQLREQSQLVSQHKTSTEDTRSQLDNVLHTLQVRESSLESLQSQLATSLTDQQRIQALLEEVTAEKQQLETALKSSNNASTVGGGNSSSNVQQLQEQLSAYQAEGQKLAKKQSEMEKSVRQSKQQLREKEVEVSKLKESREQLVKALEQTQDALKKQEAETDKAQKALQAMQAVSTASTDRLTRLEQDLQTSHDEQLATRKALEHAWSELSEAKRAQQEQRGECDDLRKQLGEGASRVMNTESMRREVEQREAVLRATSQQLQDQLQRSMSDAAAREDRLREELSELRRRWQEAVSSREHLASELAAASAPLLRQIAALQEQLRVKTEQWTQVETTLVERAMKSETAAEQFEHRRTLLEEQLQSLRLSLAQTESRLSDTQQQLMEAQDISQRLQRNEARHIEDARDWQARLAQETAQVASLHVALRDLELRHRLSLSETHETHREVERKLSTQCEELQKEVVYLRDTLAKNKMSATASTPISNSSTPPFFTYANQGSSSFSESDVADKASNSTVPANDFVASERQHQLRQRREEEIAALRNTVSSLTQARDALLEEVSFLSARNAQLEDATMSLPSLQSNAQQLQQQVDVLLVLLGEKEEENETLTEDLRETKQLYRDQLDSLLSRCLSLEQSAVKNKSNIICDEDCPASNYDCASPRTNSR